MAALSDSFNKYPPNYETIRPCLDYFIERTRGGGGGGASLNIWGEALYIYIYVDVIGAL